MFDCIGAHDDACVERLLVSGSGVDVNTKYAPFGETALAKAVSVHSIDIARALIAHGADVNVSADDGEMPLHVAAYNGDIAIVKLLIDGGARIDVREAQNGFTPLHLAIYKKHYDVGRILVESGADLVATTNDGRNAIDMAERSGDKEFYEWIKLQRAARNK
jgi:ankyrin repeat protein